MRRTIAFASVVLACLLSLPSSSFAGRFVVHELHSTAIAGNSMGISSVRRVTVHLPDGYDAGRNQYPTVYWISGFGGSIKEFVEGFDAAASANRLPAAITVLLEHEGIVFLNSPVFGRWEDFLIEELVPFIDHTYRTIASPGGRALAGHSTGGIAALLLPLRHPNVWGSIGMNDGSAYYTGFYELHVGREGELPQALSGDFVAMMKAWTELPSTLAEYGKAGPIGQMLIQLGIALSPNAAAPLHFDAPIDRDGKPVPEALARWREWCLFDPGTIARHSTALKKLSTIVMIVPDLNPADTNAYQNIYWLDLMTAAGVRVIRIDSPGGHGERKVERLVQLEEALLKPRQ